MKGNVFLFVVLLSVCGCHAKVPADLSGDYISTDCNFYQKYIDGYSLKGGVALHLDKDSTFSYTTCSEVMTGTWQIKDNSIILNCKERKQEIPSEKESDKPTVSYLDCGNSPNIIYLENGEMFERTLLNKKPRRVCYEKI